MLSQEKYLDARALRYRVDGACGCLCDCYRPFREDTVFTNLVKIHKTLQSLDKLEQDKYVKPSVVMHAFHELCGITLLDSFDVSPVNLETP